MALDKKKTMALAEKLCATFPELDGKASEVNRIIRRHIQAQVKPIDRELHRLRIAARNGEPDAALNFLKKLTEANYEEMCLGGDVER